MGSPQQISSPPPASFTTTTLPQISHLKICPSFNTFTISYPPGVPENPGCERPDACVTGISDGVRHQCSSGGTLASGKMENYMLLLPRFGGFLASAGVLISGRMCVIGKHWYSSQEHEGHFRRSCSLLSSVSSFPQSRHTYLPGPTFCPAL